MRYELAFKDKVMYALIGTKAEISPAFVMKFKTDIDGARLTKAVQDAIIKYPIVGCRFSEKGGIHYEENSGPLPIVNAPLEKKPRYFGRDTNGYLWQITYYGPDLSFDRSHVVSDGRGWLAFFKLVMRYYYGLGDDTGSSKYPEKELEDFADASAKGYARTAQPKGFRRSSVPFIRRRNDAGECHILTADMKQVLAAAHKVEASPATILAPLFSRALRANMKRGTKNRHVSCIIPIDARGPLKFDTTHNGIGEAEITYRDRFDGMDLSTVSTIYRAILDLQVQPESMIEHITKQYRSYTPILNIKFKGLQKLIFRIAGSYAKSHQANFVLTYLGKASFAPEVLSDLSEYYVRSWHQFMDCNISAVDLNGTLFINVIENYQNKKIIDDFIHICHDAGIDLKKLRTYTDRQMTYKK